MTQTRPPRCTMRRPDGGTRAPPAPPPPPRQGFSLLVEEVVGAHREGRQVDGAPLAAEVGGGEQLAGRLDICRGEDGAAAVGRGVHQSVCTEGAEEQRGEALLASGRGPRVGGALPRAEVGEHQGAHVAPVLLVGLLVELRVEPPHPVERPRRRAEGTAPDAEHHHTRVEGIEVGPHPVARADHAHGGAASLEGVLHPRLVPLDLQRLVAGKRHVDALVGLLRPPQYLHLPVDAFHAAGEGARGHHAQVVECRLVSFHILSPASKSVCLSQ